MSEFKIFANELKQVVVAEISDFENNDTLTISNLKVECQTNESKWINPSGSTSTRVSLLLKLPSNVVDDTCTFEFTINDNDSKAPISLTKIVTIQVFHQSFPDEKIVEVK